MNSKLLILFLVVSSFLASPKGGTPGTFFYSGEKLRILKESFETGTLKKDVAISRLMRDAKKTLSVEIPSIVEKKQVPPSGDKHDYTSFGGYWWPDTTKPDGKPYIRRDGVTNPEVNDYTDKIYLNKVITTVNTLALAYYISGDETYSKKALEILRKWFILPETKMNPNLEYAGFVPGRNNGGGKSGLIDTHRIYLLVDALVLLEDSEAMSIQDSSALHSWMSDYLYWLTHSKNGVDEGKSKNNHGTWYDVQVISLALYTGNLNLAKQVAENAKVKRISSQVESDGKQPYELQRTNSWGYSNFNLVAFFYLSILSERAGVDIWNYDDNGKSIRKALDYLLPFALDTTKWKTQQISKFSIKDLYSILLIAEKKYQSFEYGNWRRRLFDAEYDKGRANLFL